MPRTSTLAVLPLLLTCALSQAWAAGEEKIPLDLKFEKGAVHRLAARVSAKIEGKAQMEREFAAKLRFTVLDIDESGAATIEMRFESVRFKLVTSSDPKHPVDFDSTAKPGSAQNDSPFGAIAIDNPVRYVVKSDGSSKPIETDQKKIIDAVNDLSGKHPKPSGSGFDDMYVIAFLNQANTVTWDLALFKRPANPAAVGEHWSTNRSNGRNKTSIDYTLRGRRDGAIQVDAKTDMGGTGVEPFPVLIDEKTHWPKETTAKFQIKSPDGASTAEMSVAIKSLEEEPAK